MLQDVIKRLKWIGYTYVEVDDKELVEYLINKVTNDIKVFCNIDTIPVELNQYHIDRVTGEFLLNKKDSGQLTLDDINLDGVAKVIQLGDTKVEYATDTTKSPEQRFDALITYLLNAKKEMLVSFRQLRW